MPENDTFKIDTIQIKRIQKPEDIKNVENIILKDGELCAIPQIVRGDIYYFLISGDGKSSIKNIISVMNPFNAQKNIYQTINNLYPNIMTGIPKEVSNNNNIGQQPNFARADHVHKISKETIETQLEVNSNAYAPKVRKISCGVGEPSGGNNGDIYIKIKG